MNRTEASRITPDSEPIIPNMKAIGARLADKDWADCYSELNGTGFSIVKDLLTPDESRSISSLYDEDSTFRKEVVMQKHGFGQGRYKYFSYPLPAVVQDLRSSLYPKLADIANNWHESMGIDTRFPPSHEEFLDTCHRSGQTKPTPLLLKYKRDDYNCLHQDLYGEHVFPLQVAILLSDPGSEFEGGEFVLTEQRPRMQSKVNVVPLTQGDAVIFAVNTRPVKGTRGFYRVVMRHGVSRLRHGERYTLGIIFHEAVT